MCVPVFVGSLLSNFLDPGPRTFEVLVFFCVTPTPQLALHGDGVMPIASQKGQENLEPIMALAP